MHGCLNYNSVFDLQRLSFLLYICIRITAFKIINVINDAAFGCMFIYNRNGPADTIRPFGYNVHNLSQ